MSSQENFPERLRAYRRSMGWTQKQLAKRWNYSFAAISAWERGKRFPSGQEIPRLALRLEMEPKELVRCINESRQPAKLEQIAGKEQEWRDASIIGKELERIYLNRTEFTSDFSYPRLFGGAETILAVGISLNAIAMAYSTEIIIKSILESKSTYYLCFLDPNGIKCAEREKEENLPPGTLAELTRLNISHMQSIQNQLSKISLDYARRLEIMIYDLLPRYNIYIVDDVLMTVQSYAYARGEDTPTFVLRRQGRHGLFEFYASIAEHILKQARPVRSQ